jgi:hypothetical protein
MANTVLARQFLPLLLGGGLLLTTAARGEYQLDSRLSATRTAEAQDRLRAADSMFAAMLPPTSRDSTVPLRAIPVLLFPTDAAATPPPDYYAAGGLPKSSGYFDGVRLLVCVGPEADEAAWRVLQHEAFHAYLRYHHGNDPQARLLPPWLEEGLAEYTGEAVYAGDRYITGAVHRARQSAISGHITAGRFVPLGELMRLPRESWNAALGDVYYDQAYALIHYLLHAESRRHEPTVKKLVAGFLLDDPDMRREALQSFGPVEALQRRMELWWLSQPPDATPELYAQADTRLIATELATARAAGVRAMSRVEPVEAFRAMLQAQTSIGSGGDVTAAPATTRPSLTPTQAALTRAPLWGTWQWLPARRRGEQGLLLTLPDASEVTARWADGKILELSADTLARETARAKTLWETGQQPAARDLLARALADHPRSQHAPAARQTLKLIANQVPPRESKNQ